MSFDAAAVELIQTVIYCGASGGQCSPLPHLLQPALTMALWCGSGLLECYSPSFGGLLWYCSCLAGRGK